MRRATLTLLGVICLAYGVVASADDYNEALDGDLSGDRFNPTVINLDPGSNTITATSVAGDREYYTVTIPPGAELGAIVLSAYASLDDVSFIAVQNGTTFTEPPTGTDVTQLLGWVHFGPPEVGTDILDNMGSGSGAIGFSPPLPPGDYVFWSQQTGSDLTTYAVDFQVTVDEFVPAVSGVALFVLCVGLGLISIAVTRRRAPARPR
jgi:hypothetical protein